MNPTDKTTNPDEFRPHCIILTNRLIPQPIFVAAFLGVNRLLRIDFDVTTEPSTYIGQALDGVRVRLERWKGDADTVPTDLPAFGRVTGVVINYSPDRAVRFDLDGNVIENLDRTYRVGQATLEVGEIEEAEGI